MSPRSLGVVAGAALVAAGFLTWMARNPEEPIRSASPPAAATSTEESLADPLDEPAPAWRQAVEGSPLTAETPPAAAFSGVVVAPDETPVANASVELYGNVPGWRQLKALAAAATQPDGSFRIPTDDPDITVTLVARAAGLAERVVRTVRPTGSLRVVLPWAGEIHGRVLDRETEHPIPDALVSLDAEDVSTTETDMTGSYRFNGVPVGEPLDITASKEGYLPSKVGTVLQQRGSSSCDHLLDRSTDVRITVVDAWTGESIAGAKVSTRRNQTPITTAEDGSFVLCVASGHVLDVSVTAQGYAQLSWVWNVTDPGFLDGAQVPLRGFAWIEGVVVDDQGSPSGGVELWIDYDDDLRLGAEEMLERRLSGQVRNQVPTEHVTTNDLGRFSLAVVPDDSEYSVTTGGQDHAYFHVGNLHLEVPGQRRELRIVLTEGATIRGRLLCNGAPWHKGNILSLHDSGAVEEALPDEEGRYEIARIPEGTITLRVRSPAGDVLEPVVLEVEAGQVYEHDFEWTEQVATISGRVTNSAGEPVPGIGIWAWSEVQGSHRSTKTESDGTYTVVVATGQVHTVQARGSWPSRSGVLPGSNRVDFELAELGVLELNFVEKTTGDSLAIADLDGWNLGWRANGQGTFEPLKEPLDWDAATGSAKLPIGLVDLSVYPIGFAPERLFGISVEPEPRRNAVSVALTRAVEAQIELVGDAPLDRKFARAHLIFFLERSQLDFVRGPFAPEKAGNGNLFINGICVWIGDPGLMNRLISFDETGTALLRDLSPGTYTLRAFPDDLVFLPEEIEVVGPRTEVEVRWARR